MRFYTQQHRHYCGIDLHARSMYICLLDQSGKTLVHRKLSCDSDELLRVLRPYRKDLVVAVECLFCWYWIADRCVEQGIAFVLGVRRQPVGVPKATLKGLALPTSGNRALILFQATTLQRRPTRQAEESGAGRL